MERIFYIVICILLIVASVFNPNVFQPNSTEAEPMPENDNHPAIMIDEKLYLCAGEIYRDGEEVEILGYITSCVDLRFLPEEHEQSNFPACLEQPYGVIHSTNTMVVYYSGYWRICHEAINNLSGD